MRILFLSTWFPYPLSQGSKIRAYYLLRSLAKQHEVALLSFADTEIEPGWIEHMRNFCSRVEVVPKHPFHHSRIKSLLGWFSSRPSAVTATYSPEMRQRVESLASTWKPDCVVGLTFVTAPYAEAVEGAVKIVDVDNFMSPMLYELCQSAGSKAEQYRRWLAWWKFRQYERQLYRQFDGCLVVSDLDAHLISTLFSIDADKMCVVNNGVDTTWNIPDLAAPQPGSLIFNGSLTYDFNFDAIQYFLTEIFPSILASEPGTRLSVTGKITDEIKSRLPSLPQLAYTGYLEDVRPAVASSWACTVPLRMGGGSRLKILEAMALGTPVVSTSKGAEGLSVEDGRHLLIANNPEEFAEKTLSLLHSPELRSDLANQARKRVREWYDWEDIGVRFCRFVEELVETKAGYQRKTDTLTAKAV